MACVNSTKTAPHFLWGEGCEGWWLKQGGKFTVISEIMLPHASELRHLHENTEQFFYVLEGALTIELDGQEYKLEQHNGMVIPPMSPHRVFNSSNQVVKFLVISCPDSHEDRVNLE
jgi:mannose-6-phosphate isomerase-like protein (cupin superfamily)